MQSVVILGRQPKIGLAELESLYGPKVIKPILPGTTFLDLGPKDVHFNRLGGSIKLGQVVKTCKIGKLKSELIHLLPQVLPKKDSKINFGLSSHGLELSVNDINKLALNLKKVAKTKGYNLRIIPNRTPELNAAQVLNNYLTSKGVELMLVKSVDQVIVAKTIDVQDIDAYAARDQARPKRDAFVGMLPPKLAQIIINLASGDIKPCDVKVLDPFCGTGVMLQEALLMGFDVLGSDVSPKMVDYSTANIDWLKNKYRIDSQIKIEHGDATNHIWSNVDLVASETYLGRPMSSLPPQEKLMPMVADINQLHIKFLTNLHGQLKPGTRLCLGIPAWVKEQGYICLPLIDQLSQLGYNLVAFENAEAKDLIYSRPGQTVARQLITLIRK
jgi:tRNA (guanine10-N2)-dimethyltransferase